MLRDYQERISNLASALLADKGLAYLAMQTRTGKTITALATAEKYGAQSILFVTKLKAIPSITKDAALFPALKVTVVNPEQLHNVKDKYDLIIVDEAHSYGAVPKPSLRTKMLKQLTKGKPVLLLSGTPTPEGYHQIYHQFYLSDNSPFREHKNFYSWAKEYINIREKRVGVHIIKEYKDAKTELILPLVEPYMIFCTQEEAGFKAKVVDKFIECDFNAKYIDALRRDGVLKLSDGKCIIADTPVAMQGKIHQLSSGHCIDEDGVPRVFGRGKLDAIKPLLDKHIAIFYKYDAERMILLDEIENATVSVEEFQSDPSKIFIGQIQSIREGVKLDTAEAIVMYTPDFSATSYWQARDRLQNIHREGELPVYFVINKSGICLDVYKAVSAKKNYTLNYFKRWRG